jgi:hypothetical protein
LDTRNGADDVRVPAQEPEDFVLAEPENTGPVLLLCPSLVMNEGKAFHDKVAANKFDQSVFFVAVADVHIDRFTSQMCAK